MTPRSPQRPSARARRRSAAGDGDLCLLNVKAGAKPACIEDPSTDVGRSVSWSPDGRQILVAGHPKDRPDTFGLVLYRSSKPFSTRAADSGKGAVVTDASRAERRCPGRRVLARRQEPCGRRQHPRQLPALHHQGRRLQAQPGQAIPGRRLRVAWRPDGAELAVVQTPNCSSDSARPDRPLRPRASDECRPSGRPAVRTRRGSRYASAG